MKFLVRRRNQYQNRHWNKDESHEFSKGDVEAEIALGRHEVTNKPMSPLLNHWVAIDREAEKAVADFVEAGRNGRSKAPEEVAEEKAFDIIAKITSAKNAVELGDMVHPGETRKSILNAFNKRAEELAKQNDNPDKSTDTTVAKTVEHIEKLQTVEAVSEFVDGDDRAGVAKAVAFITKKLGG